MGYGTKKVLKNVDKSQVTLINIIWISVIKLKKLNLIKDN